MTSLGDMEYRSSPPAGTFPPLRRRHLWLGLPAFLLICKALIFPLPLLDFWWHLKMGQIIVETGSIPKFDLFSFTAAGKPFVVHNWLAEVLYYLTYRLGGDPLIICLNVALLVAALGPIYRLCRDASSALWIQVFAVTMVAFGVFGNTRPQVFSFPLFAVFLSVLYGYRQGKHRRVWLLPILMVLWVNLHGAFIVGLGLILLFLACGHAESLISCPGRARLGRRQLGGLWIVFVLCLLATLVNPEGYRVYSYVETVFRDPASRQFVIEWQPPRIDTIQGSFLFYLPFFLTLTVLVCARKGPDLTDLVLFFGFAAFGLTATRNSVWFILVNSPILARYLTVIDWSTVSSRLGALRSRNPAGEGSQSHTPVDERSTPWMDYSIAGLAGLIVLVFSPWVQNRVFHASLLDPKTPIGAIDYVERHSLTGNIFHPQIYGDYLIWRLWPRQHTFFDGRVHLFSEDLVRTYRQVFRDSAWEDLLARFKIRYLLLDKDGDTMEGSQRIIDQARASASWRVLYEDSLSILLAKAGDAEASELAGR